MDAAPNQFVDSQILKVTEDGCTFYVSKTSGTDGRLLRIDNAPKGWTKFFEGKPGMEHMVTLKRGCDTFYYTGSKGEERVWMLIHSNGGDGHGVQLFFKGKKGAERMVRRVLPAGTEYYEGPAGAERIVRLVRDENTLEYYEGEASAEHLVRCELQDSTKYYEGPRGKEHVVRVAHHDGRVKFLDGPRGEEHVVRIAHTDGRTVFFDGPRGKERLVSVATTLDATPSSCTESDTERADTNAAMLIEEEDKSKERQRVAADKKHAKKRARRANKKRLQLVPENPALPSCCEPDTLKPVPPAEALEFANGNFVSLTDVREALCSLESDAATSVATSLQCVVCMTNERSVACVPCGHRCLCESCAVPSVVGSKCPMCRADVQMFMRVFG